MFEIHKSLFVNAEANHGIQTLSREYKILGSQGFETYSIIVPKTSNINLIQLLAFDPTYRHLQKVVKYSIYLTQYSKTFAIRSQYQKI